MTAAASPIHRNIGIAHIDLDALARLLQLPAGQRITGVYCPANREALELRIEGDGMPLVRLGELIPSVQLNLKS